MMRVFRNHLALLLTLGALLSQTERLAHAEGDARKTPIYNQILQDLGHDILEYDGSSMAASDRQSLAQKWLAFITDLTASNPLEHSPFSSSMLWPPRPLPASNLPVQVSDVRVVTLPKSAAATPHSIKDLGLYADGRLGPALAAAIRSKTVEVEVAGETTERLASEMAKEGRKLIRIPSLYEQWDIEKFFEVTEGLERPRVIIRIPPNEQYVRHYAQIVESQGGLLRRAFINEADRAGYHESLKSSVSALIRSLPKKPEYVSLGYTNQWDQVLSQPDSQWMLESSSEVHGLDGLSAKVFQLRKREQPDTHVELLALSHDKTLWGEASAFLIEGTLEHQPKAVFFMGSAGGISTDLKVYDVSVPSNFDTQAGPVQIFNQVDLMTHPSESQSRKLSNGATVIYSQIHGNTNSPAEQTQAFIRDLSQKKVSSLDVEQSLVAQTISDFNSKSGAHVEFGAVNVITDKPMMDLPGSSPASVSHEHDLTKVDPALKSRARLAAVKTVLETMATEEASPAALDAKRIALIQRALPGSDAGQILIRGGQGKVDADPKRKLSYFVTTAKPTDASSRTVLIPMATSRFDKYNYQTDEWWDAHKDEIATARKNGQPVPHQDPNEVAAWLRANQLSTNPDVLMIDVQTNQISKVPLKDFLLAEYLERFTVGDSVILYRGAEKPDELSVWKSGMFPRGVRYWTPDANYAWRYGRKSPDFMDKTLKGGMPVFRFKIPKDEFVGMVKRGELVLGTEMTKKAHDGFKSGMRFVDQLTGNTDYLGEGKYGLEFEIRGTRRARNQFVRYFDGAVSIEEMADARARQIRVGTERLVRQNPSRAAELKKTEKARLEQVEAEKSLMTSIRSGRPAARVQSILQSLKGNPEIANIDGSSLSQIAKNYIDHPWPAAAAVEGALAAPCSRLYEEIEVAGDAP